MQALYAQLLVGLINGSFYALLSLGLAVIFAMLNIINFAHGGFLALGAHDGDLLLNQPLLKRGPDAAGFLDVLELRPCRRAELLRQVLDAAGYAPTAYAYPFGEHTGEMDSAVLSHVGKARVSPGSCPW